MSRAARFGEAEWLASGDPALMLRFLGGRVSERKLRLFACACCRRWGTWLPRIAHDALELAEISGEGVEQRHEVRRIDRELANEIRRLNRNGDPIDPADPTATILWAVRKALGPMQPHDVRSFLDTASGLLLSLNWWFRVNRPDDVRNAGPSVYQTSKEAREGESRVVAALLREVVGNPFRPLVLNPAWLVSGGVAVRKLAETIYQGQTFGDLPILADALEDAGCDNADILGHLRASGPHVRGCWPVDLLLGRG